MCGSRVRRKEKGRSPVTSCPEWDWSKPDVEIAREEKQSIQRVRGLRIRFGIAPISAQKVRERRLKEWETWDWSKRDSHLAKENGMGRERVRQIRAELGKPLRQRILHERATAKRKAFVDWVAGRKEVDF